MVSEHAMSFPPLAFLTVSRGSNHRAGCPSPRTFPMLRLPFRFLKLERGKHSSGRELPRVWHVYTGATVNLM